MFPIATDGCNLKCKQISIFDWYKLTGTISCGTCNRSPREISFKLESWQFGGNEQRHVGPALIAIVTKYVINNLKISFQRVLQNKP